MEEQVKVTKRENKDNTVIFSFDDGAQVTYRNVDPSVISAGIKASPEESDNIYFAAIYEWLEGDRHEYNQLSGKCSNIPQCCIDFYCDKWFDYSFTERKAFSHHWGYVACPQCIEDNNKVKLGECKDDGSCCPSGRVKQLVRMSANE